MIHPKGTQTFYKGSIVTVSANDTNCEQGTAAWSTPKIQTLTRGGNLNVLHFKDTQGRWGARAVTAVVHPKDKTLNRLL